MNKIIIEGELAWVADRMFAGFMVNGSWIENYLRDLKGEKIDPCINGYTYDEANSYGKVRIAIERVDE